MLNGPALLRVFLVVIAAAVLTGLVQHYWIFENSPPEPTVVVARPSAQNAPVRRADPPPARPIARPQATSPAMAAPTPPPPPIPEAQTPEPAPVAPPDTRNASLAPSPPPAAIEPPPAQASTPPMRTPPPPAPVAAQPESGGQEIAAAEAADPRAVDLVDLNTGSLSELNKLKGGGAIGRAIIQRRPYASTDQLLSKRVLSRAIYQRIKDQVMVR